MLGHLSPVMGRVLQVWQRTLWLTFWLTDRRYKVGNHSNRRGSLCSHDNTCSSLAVGVNTCKHAESVCHHDDHQSPAAGVFCVLTPLKQDLTAVSTPPKTPSSCTATGTWTHTFVREREERGRLGNVVCTVFTWLRSCSKDLSPDLLTDPEQFSATLTRAAGHKVSECVLFWRNKVLYYIEHDLCILFWKSGRCHWACSMSFFIVVKKCVCWAGRQTDIQTTGYQVLTFVFHRQSFSWQSDESSLKRTCR